MGTAITPRLSFRLPKLLPEVSLVAAAAIAIALLTWSGLRSGKAASLRKAELSRVRADLAGFEDLNRRYAPAVAAESLSWRQTWLQLRELGVVGDERLATTRTVTRTAEASGLSDVQVLIGASDTTGLEKRLSTGGIGRKPAPFSLLVECRGGMRAVIAFVGQLPPSVAVTRMSLVRQDGRQRHRISLAVYQLEFTNGDGNLFEPPSTSAAPDVGSSVERGAVARGVGGRAGG